MDVFETADNEDGEPLGFDEISNMTLDELIQIGAQGHC